MPVRSLFCHKEGCEQPRFENRYGMVLCRKHFLEWNAKRRNDSKKKVTERERIRELLDPTYKSPYYHLQPNFGPKTNWATRMNHSFHFKRTWWRRRLATIESAANEKLFIEDTFKEKLRSDVKDLNLD